MNFKSLLITFFLLNLSLVYSQTLSLKSGGNIIDSNNQKLTPTEVRTLLNNTPELLNQYDAGRTKKTVGNILMGAGIGFIIGDLAAGATQDITYPTAFTFIGMAALVIAIPIKIGYSKKIKSAVDGYNKKVAVKDCDFKIESSSVIANQNGIGILFTF
ncbi:hypothetical protein MCETHM1_02719 [Flavobacteriaceae bacterium]